MGRSIHCSKCKKEKEPGRDNESYCWTCKSERKKELRALKRQEKGMSPLGSGRSEYCYDCKAIKEVRSRGYCNSCNAKRDNEWRLRTGRTKKHQTGLCPCGKDKASYSKSYCLECTAKRDKEWRETHELTEDQIARRNELQRKRYVKRRGPKKERLDPVLWEKPKRPLFKPQRSRVNGKPIICGRPNCSNTEGLLSNGWCKPCAAVYQRERLKYYEPAPKTEVQKIRHRVRALTRSYIKSGKLIKGLCEVCGINEDVEAHHDDYNKPMDIRWLCRKHHREHHKFHVEHE